jgi:queuine/archaeosine tRNA-ribosyltransferase
MGLEPWGARIPSDFPARGPVAVNDGTIPIHSYGIAEDFHPLPLKCICYECNRLGEVLSIKIRRIRKKFTEIAQTVYVIDTAAQE